MTYSDCISYLYGLQQTGFKLGLDNTNALCHALGDPQKALRFIHLAGTNGKGSTAAILESIFRACGYRTGLFSSPHLVDFTERIRIDFQPISQERLVDEVQKLRMAMARLKVQNIAPTFFEATTGLAFNYFKEEKVDVVILETGLGGRLDSTNVVTPECSIITSIGKDHMEFLGDTLAEIAREKAGILKKERPVIIGKLETEAIHVIQDKAKEMSAPLFQSERVKHCESKKSERSSLKQIFQLNNGEEYSISLLGEHQSENAALALKTIEVLETKTKQEQWKFPRNKVELGVQQARWPGRFEVCSLSPPLILDGAHNIEGMRKTRETWLECFGSPPRRFIFGCKKSKVLKEVIEQMDENSHEVWLVPLSTKQGESPEKLASFFSRAKVLIFDSLEQAWLKHQESSSEEGVLLWGSLYLIGEAKALMEEKGHQLALNDY